MSADLWAGLERGNLSRWPTGIYARSSVRAYAGHIGVDPEATVDEFCRCFPHGDRRAEPVVREQAAIVSHDLQWTDDLATARAADRLTSPYSARAVGALADILAQMLTGGVLAAMTRLEWSGAVACSAIGYQVIALLALGGSPAARAIEALVERSRPSAPDAGTRRSLRRADTFTTVQAIYRPSTGCEPPLR